MKEPEYVAHRLNDYQNDPMGQSKHCGYRLCLKIPGSHASNNLFINWKGAIKQIFFFWIPTGC